jgi:hypothetical protein
MLTSAMGDDEPCHVWAGGVPWRVEEDDEGRQQRGDGCEHKRTLKRAKAKLKIITEKGGYQGEWQWRLP